MARPREFDEAAVLDAAIERFWLRGYEATSVRDLADEMNIAGASLYNTFGDKRGLYERALNRYLDQTFRERIRRIEPTHPPREAITVFLQEIINRSLTDKQRRGCMLVNSAIESAPFDPDFLEIVGTFLDEVEAFFLRCVAKGQKDGTITRAHTAADLSKSLLGVLLGIRVLARVRPQRALLEGLARPIFGLLGNKGSGRRTMS
ncbi:TetR/AcrR family transcriptional regulator [Bradyrhizobium elkanii]|jgi:TetR/AcrR family transcriptional regulator, transcriptional repressor for nem operon|uniref:TetR/AcrR family transcriptional regulator n=1 Tax=Bradyrhizobium elkanii TaxID=29448 RepID=UPI0021688557|nr:TetR/AcrR family transcriptional regulator [Bradyrhizobium elkanii]MCS3474163.1 TetR/AcrR family transcriptional repressor of nem operon [Bradyrhizobium elkanii]